MVKLSDGVWSRGVTEALSFILATCDKRLLLKLDIFLVRANRDENRKDRLQHQSEQEDRLWPDLSNPCTEQEVRLQPRRRTAEKANGSNAGHVFSEQCAMEAKIVAKGVTKLGGARLSFVSSGLDYRYRDLDSARCERSSRNGGSLEDCASGVRRTRSARVCM